MYKTVIFSADISKSADNNPGFMLPVGQPFKLICQLTESVCQETSSNDTVTLLPQRSVSAVSEGTMSRITDCSVTYQVKHASTENSNEYICSKNGVTLMKQQITILGSLLKYSSILKIGVCVLPVSDNGTIIESS